MMVLCKPRCSSDIFLERSCSRYHTNTSNIDSLVWLIMQIDVLEVEGVYYGIYSKVT